MQNADINILDTKLDVTGGSITQLKNLKGQNIVLYFYPKDDTPGCTAEGKDFTGLIRKFESANTRVLGVSRDSLSSHDKFKKKYNYKLDLISDTEEVLCRFFDVIKEKNMYGKKVFGIERSTFVLDKKGKLVKEWRKVKVPGHAKEVLEFVKTLA